MKVLAAIFLLILPEVINAQGLTSVPENAGIQWIENLSWAQILDKAKSEKKYVFVDCYATWCGPCKAMDKNVYPNAKVGESINSKFIAVKIQMDKTSNDNEEVKRWYNDAKSLEKKYNVNAYPTLLFFTSDGALVHRVTQGLNVDGFLEVVSTALDPKKRYYSRLAEYQNGNKDTSVLRDLVKAAHAANDKKMATAIAEDYITQLKVKNLKDKNIRDFIRQYSQSAAANKLANEYINNLKKKELFTKENLGFIRHFTKESTQRGFKLFYKQSGKVNEIMENIPLPKGATSQINQGDFAQSAVRSIIYSEEFYQAILKPAFKDSANAKVPNWDDLVLSIQRKYPKTDAMRIVADAKTIWYGWRKEWNEYGTSVIQRMDLLYSGKSLMKKGWNINGDCWNLFLYVSDKSSLNAALGWMEKLFKDDPGELKWSGALDTYANLLYKVGRKDEAIEWETKALIVDPTDNEIIETLDKMKKGLPTWPAM